MQRNLSCKPPPVSLIPILVFFVLVVQTQQINVRTSESEKTQEMDFGNLNGEMDNEPPILPPRKEWTEELMSAVNIEQIEQELETQLSPLTETSSDHKLRFNYAAEQCGAKIVETSTTSIKGADNILSRSFDSYMLTYCAYDNWIVIELCEEIVIDSIVLGNKEFFSSNFKDFTVYGNKRFPAVEWNEIARFTAQNIKETQPFEFEEKEVYKYLRIDFNSHYGDEFYCPVTVTKVYGYTLVEDLREQVELSQAKLQNFNKLMNEATKSRHKMNLEELPAFPDITQETENYLSSDLLSSEMADLMQAFMEEIKRNTPKDENENEARPSSSNIFADLASHITSLEMRHSLLSGYLDQFRTSCSKKFSHFSHKREEDFHAMLDAIGNATAPLERSIEDLQKNIKAISVLNMKYNWLKKELYSEQDNNAKELVYVVLASILTTIATTLIIFCLFYESPPIRNPAASRLLRSFSFDRSKPITHFSSAPLDDLHLPATSSPRTHRRDHSQ